MKKCVNGKLHKENYTYVNVYRLPGSGSDQIFGTPIKNPNSKADLYIESLGLLKKIPNWLYYKVIFSKNFWATKGSTRRSYFRQWNWTKVNMSEESDQTKLPH